MSATLRHGAIKVRTATNRRYAVVLAPLGDPTRAFVDLRTNDLVRAQTHARKLGWTNRLIFDTTTGGLA